MRSSLRCVRLRSSSPSSYVCLRCRSQRLSSRLSSSPSLISYTTQRYASDDSKDAAKGNFIERTRKRIWGTKHPPGQKDPYQRLTPRERERQAREAEEARELELQKLEGQGEADAEVLAAAEEEYEPAATWDGLERIGGPTGWWEEEWDKENQFEGFLTGPKMSHEQARATIRRVLVELLALQEAGRPPADSWIAPFTTDVDHDGIDIAVSADGQGKLSYKDPAIQVELLESLVPVEDEVGLEAGQDSVDEIEEVPEDTQPLETADAQVQYSEETVDELAEEVAGASKSQASGPQASEEGPDTIEQEQSWLAISLEDLEFKFAFVKRLMSLSKIRIHDPNINEFKTVGDIVAHMSEKPKPKKLAELLLSQPELMALPNVEVFERRYTPIDKEKEVGRWKVIEAELVKRGLPVTGHQVN